MPIARLAGLRSLRIAHVAALSIAAFYVVTFFAPQPALMQFLNICTLSVAIAVVITYAPIWIETLMRPIGEVSGTEMLSLGIGCTWTSEIGQRIWSLIWRGMGHPEVMTTNYSLPFLLYISVLGGIQHITSPGAVNGFVPTRNWIVLGIRIGTSTLVTLLSLWWTGFRV
jgi:hypothetical protein